MYNVDWMLIQWSLLVNDVSDMMFNGDPRTFPGLESYLMWGVERFMDIPQRLVVIWVFWLVLISINLRVMGSYL